MKSLLASPNANRSLTGAIHTDGVKLIIRNAWKELDTVHDPVLAIRQVIKDITAKDLIFAGFPVDVLPFRANQPHPATCYLTLCSSFIPENSPPRDDLLLHWCNVIIAIAPTLEVEWVPSHLGSDKQMWLHIPNVTQAREAELKRLQPDHDDDEPEDAKRFVPMIKQVFTSKNTPIYNSFAIDHAIVVEMVLTDNHSQLIELGSIHVPAILSLPLPIIAINHIPVLHPFEIIITGCSNYDPPPAKFLHSWIHQNCAIDGSSIYDERMAGMKDDAYIFSAEPWAVTQKILKAAELFQNQIMSHYTDLTPHQLLYTYNSNPVIRKINTRDVVTQGANRVVDTLNDGHKKLSQCLDKIEKNKRAHTE